MWNPRQVTVNSSKPFFFQILVFFFLPISRCFLLRAADFCLLCESLGMRIKPQYLFWYQLKCVWGTEYPEYPLLVFSQHFVIFRLKKYDYISKIKVGKKLVSMQNIRHHISTNAAHLHVGGFSGVVSCIIAYPLERSIFTFSSQPMILGIESSCWLYWNKFKLALW